MTKNYDLPHEEQQKLERVMQALRNVPEVGQPFDQQHADTHLDAEALLADVITMFRMGQLIRNQDDTPLVDAKNRSLPREQVAEIAQDNARASGMGNGEALDLYIEGLDDGSNGQPTNYENGNFSDHWF